MRLEDPNGNYIGPRKTYRTGGNVVTANDALPWLVINGAANKVIRIQRIRISGMSLTAATLLRMLMRKHSSAWTGGTPVAATLTPIDSQAPPTAATISHYTAGPTGGGAVVGPLAERRALGIAGGTPALVNEVDFDFGSTPYDEVPTLRAATENISLAFAVAPGSATTLSYEVEYTEDNA